METAWQYTSHNDDIWYYFMALRLHHRIRLVKGGYPKSIFVNAQRELRMTDEVTLAMQNVMADANDVQFRSLLELYPDLLNLMIEH